MVAAVTHHSVPFPQLNVSYRPSTQTLLLTLAVEGSQHSGYFHLHGLLYVCIYDATNRPVEAMAMTCGADSSK